MVYRDFFGRRRSFGLYPHDENSYPRPTIRIMINLPSPDYAVFNLFSPVVYVPAIPTNIAQDSGSVVIEKNEGFQDRQFLDILAATVDVRRAIHDSTFDFHAADQKKRDERLQKKQMNDDLEEISLLKTIALRRRMHGGPFAFLECVDKAGLKDTFQNLVLDKHLLLTRDLHRDINEMRHEHRIGRRRDWDHYIAVNQIRHADRNAVFEFWALGWQNRVLGMTCSMRRWVLQVPSTIMEEEEECVNYDLIDVTASDNVPDDAAALQSLMQSDGCDTESQARDVHGLLDTTWSGVYGLINCRGSDGCLDVLEQTLDLRSGWQEETDECLYYAIDALEDSVKLRSAWQDLADLWLCYVVFFPEDSIRTRTEWRLPVLC